MKMTVLSKSIITPQAAVIDGEGITIKGEVKEKKFSHFRNSVSADLNSVEIHVNSKAIVKANGETLSEKDQLDLLASYQSAQIKRNVPRIIESVRRFLSGGNYSVNERFIPTGVDPDSKAREWLKISLYHALCGIGTSFQHDGVNYHVVTSSELHTITGMKAISFINGNSSINLKGNVGDIIQPSKDISVLVDIDLVTSAMEEIIKSLSITINNGGLYVQGILLRLWTPRESINVEAADNKLSDITLNI